jgi:hypothetical protein
LNGSSNAIRGSDLIEENGADVGGGLGEDTRALACMGSATTVSKNEKIRLTKVQLFILRRWVVVGLVEVVEDDVGVGNNGIGLDHA